jgi:hypothetical protein
MSNRPDENLIPVLTEIIELAPEIERAAAGPLADLDLSLKPAPAQKPAPVPPAVSAPAAPALPSISALAAVTVAPDGTPQDVTALFPAPLAASLPAQAAQVNVVLPPLTPSAAPAPLPMPQPAARAVEHVAERVVEKIVEVEKFVDRIVEVEKPVERIVEKIVEVEKPVEIEKVVIETKLVEVPPTDEQLEELERRVREAVTGGIGPRVEQLLQQHLKTRLDSILHFTLSSLEQELREAIDVSLREAISDSVHEQISQQKLNFNKREL